MPFVKGSLASILAAISVLAAASAASAQTPIAGTVSRVVDGDTVDAQLVDGRAVRVRIIGIDTPERGACATDEASAFLEQLVSGRNLTFTGDLTQPTIDRFGRSLFYIDRDDGLDVGRELILAGWAEVFLVGADFARYPDYLRAEDQAAASTNGVGTTAMVISTALAPMRRARSAKPQSPSCGTTTDACPIVNS